jgi:MbtH protein
VRAEEDEMSFRVVKNRQGQYAIWPVDRENARGWSDAGKSGSR